MPPEDIEVGDDRLRRHVERVGRGRRPGRNRVDALGALEQPDLAEAQRGLRVGGVLGERFLVCRDRRVQVATLDRVVGRCDQGRQLVLGSISTVDAVGALGGCRRVVPDRDPTRDAHLHGQLEQLVDPRLDLRRR